MPITDLDERLRLHFRTNLNILRPNSPLIMPQHSCLRRFQLHCQLIPANQNFDVPVIFQPQLLGAYLKGQHLADANRLNLRSFV